ncbi:hypothetical protein [Sporosarcina beigongshangi]|uniref:hypothetical protein n=1 Tax=Sporosarcina beigongshangi TaxID=2782538 RepID=UPI00193A7701|nr:hypothetical protein [Sporosarcina beigongshangi]
MRKIIRFTLLFVFVMVLAACSQTVDPLEGKVSQLEADKVVLSENLDNQENKIEKLTQNIAELEKQIDATKKEKDIFPGISNLSREFVRAHTSGDKEKLQELLSEDIILVDRDNELFAKHGEDEYEWLLFSRERKVQLDDWVIQGYQYDSENDTFHIHIREFYVDINGEPDSPPTFLGLSFKMFNNEWKIISLAFDV